MAIFGKDRERGERTRTSAFDAPVSAGSGFGEGEMYERDRVKPATDDASGSGAFLGRGSRVVGKVSFEGPARIEGTVEGEVVAQDTLTIGESAVVNAQVTGNAIVIHGRVTGDVVARKRLEIRAPGRLLGNITTPSLVIHEGVVFEGQCTMAGDAKPAEKDRKVAIVFPKDEAEGTKTPRAALEVGK